MICFENSGEIDVDAMVTFGVNAKESANPIGFFGTGMKYAIAITLRLGGRITVQSGEREFEFYKRDTEIRGKTFGLIYMEETTAEEPTHTKLGFTTEVGKSWQPWQVVRELWCNAGDEPDARFNEEARYMQPTAGKTRVFVQEASIEEAARRRSEYILLDALPSAQMGACNVHDFKESTGLFYRGIKVMQKEKAFAWTWNIIAKMELTEDRTIKFPWQAEQCITIALMNCRNEEIVDAFLNLPKDCAEYSFQFPESYASDEHRRFFFDRLAANYKKNILEWPERLRTIYNAGKLYFSENLEESAIPMSAREKAELDRACIFLRALDFPVDKYKIIMTDGLPPSVRGTIRGKTILLNKVLFVEGAKQVAVTVLEEILHLEFGFDDESRRFQDFLLMSLVTVGERLVGEV